MQNTSFQNQAVAGGSAAARELDTPEQSGLAGLKSELGPVGLLLLVCVTGKLQLKKDAEKRETADISQWC